MNLPLPVRVGGRRRENDITTFCSVRRKLPTWVFHSVPTLEHVCVNFTRDVSKLGEEKSRNNGLEGEEEPGNGRKEFAPRS